MRAHLCLESLPVMTAPVGVGEGLIVEYAFDDRAYSGASSRSELTRRVS